MVEIEATLRFARADSAKLGAALSALTKFAGFEEPAATTTAEGTLHRQKLPARAELLVETLSGFNAGASKAGPTELYLPRLLALADSLDGAWLEMFQRAKWFARGTVEQGRFRFVFEQNGATREEGWQFLENVAAKLELPVKLSQGTAEVTHAAGLYAELKGSPSGLACDLLGDDPSVLVSCFRRFAEIVSPKGGGDVSFGAGPAPGVAPETAYATLLGADLAARQYEIDYRFPLPDPSSIPRFQALCTKSDDTFTFSLGSYDAFPEIRAEIQVETNKKGHHVSMAFSFDEAKMPTPDAIKAMRENASKLLGLPLAK